MRWTDAQVEKAERRVLGLQLARPQHIGEPWLPRPSQYVFNGHEEIACALCAVGTSATVGDVYDAIRETGHTEAVGGIQYLEELVVCAPKGLAAARNDARCVIEAIEDRTRAHVDTLRQKLAAAEAELSHAPARAVPRTLDLRQLALSPPPERSWFIRDWLGPGPTLFAASGGTGKTLLMQQAATAGALGRSFIGHVDRPLRSLVWACEDDVDELARRQVDISRHFGVDVDAAADNLTLQSRLGVDSMLMVPRQGEMVRTNVFEELRQQVNDLAVDVLWLDNVAHLFGGDEVHRGQVTSFISALAGLASGRPFSVVLLAHVARQFNSEFAGSAAWENAVRMRWYLGTKLPDQKAAGDADEGGAARFLAKRKTNYSQRDYVRFSYVDGAFSADQAAPRDALASRLDETRAEELLVAGFRSLQAMGISPTDGKSSPDFLPRQIVAKGLAHGYDAREMTRALDRLMGRGEFVRGKVGQYPNRNPKLGLILSSEVPA